MKNHGLILLFALTLLCTLCASAKKSTTLEYLKRLDEAIANSEYYDSVHENEITRIKQQALESSNTRMQMYNANNNLFLLYEKYRCDSAMKYIDITIAVTSAANRKDLECESRINKASALSQGGLFIEADNIFASIDPADVPDNKLGFYYYKLYEHYLHMAEYGSGTSYGREYYLKANEYSDSAMNYLPDDSFMYESLMSSRKVVNGDYNTFDYITSCLSKYKEGTVEYSIMANILSYYYSMRGDTEHELIYSALSAISDIKGSIKENTAIRTLAELMLAREDIDRANDYLKKSFEDAIFYSSRMRSNQSAKLLPLIDQKYKMEQEERARNHMYMTLAISIFSLALIIFIVMTMRQKAKLASESRQTKKAHEHAKEVNEQLTTAMQQIKTANTNLRESDRIKEVYIRDLMMLCSTQINTTEQFQKQLFKLSKSNKHDELNSMIKSTQIVTNAVQDFYTTFDRAFLGIFPTFVEQFNALLRPDEATITKGMTTLNTELRIYALIRLGINDSQRIAHLLRCSAATVYTYRSKMRARAIKPDDFENQVLNLSSL